MNYGLCESSELIKSVLGPIGDLVSLNKLKRNATSRCSNNVLAVVFYHHSLILGQRGRRPCEAEVFNLSRVQRGIVATCKKGWRSRNAFGDDFRTQKCFTGKKRKIGSFPANE